MKKYEIGIYEKAIPESYAMESMLEFAKDVGYDFFEISIDRTEQRIDRLYDDNFVREIIRMQQGVGLRIGSMCLSALSTYTLGNSSRAIRDRARDIRERAIQFSVNIGIRIIQIPACTVPKGINIRDENVKWYIENIHNMVEYASVYGIMLALENMESEEMNSVEKCMKLVHEVDSPYFQLYPDAGNITTASFDQGTDPKMDMKTGSGHYAAFHLKETNSIRFGGLFYGEGYVDFPQLVKHAWGLGARRYVMEYWFTGNSEWQENLKKAYSLCRNWIENSR